jgi:hypothetical protein
MSKNERSHGQQMITIGQVNLLYEMINIMMDKISKLDIIIKNDERIERENENDERRRTVKKDR